MACKLRACVQASKTKKKKKPYFVLSAVNFIAPGFNTNEKKMFTRFLHSKQHEKYQDDNVEHLCEESRKFPNGCQIFQLWIPIKFQVYIEGTSKKKS